MILRQVSVFYRFLFLVMLSLGLMIVDHRSDLLRPIRSVASVVTLPFHSLNQLPGKIATAIRSYYPDDSLFRELEDLRAKQLKLESHLQRYDALVAENSRLSKLLSAARRSDDQVILANIVNAGLDPFSHRIIINRGAEAGVFVGQPVIAPNGVLGQVSEVNLRQSIVTLVTDRSHGIPVQVQRNGLRTIVQGTGHSDRVGVPYLPRLADIRKGDVLVSSGMGGRFPAGYKVAEVDEIITDANEAFLSINATTTARIDFVKQVLLVWDSERLAVE
ncbi:MAG: rod shape-determining protein MreC [Acidiferrobacterales bacterium]|nr:rod shape-determining protein MreC [Acidiferrobacterales bacterium]